MNQAHEVAAACHYRRDAQVHWVAQIGANLLRDEELIDFIAASGCMPSLSAVDAGNRYSAGRSG
ncbi:MAG: hypothetical protein DMG72_23485 [Acidobacteria bacterium]|nr:MAG: hypothetical protein DMG72_23485 [Acidobacteriota bacterium]